MIGSMRFDYDEITSTNDAARGAIGDGAPDGSLFTAVHQTAGRGRRGTSWVARSRESVLATILLYPQTPITEVWRLGWVSCVAIIQTLADCGVMAACKWPNDVVVGGRKIAGVLIETSSAPSSSYAALVGIGINVAQQRFDEAESYRIAPTSVAMELMTEPPPIDNIITLLCQALNDLYHPNIGNWDDVVSAYTNSLIIGEKQTGTDPFSGEQLTGILIAVRESDGAGLIQISKSDNRYVIPDIAGRL